MLRSQIQPAMEWAVRNKTGCGISIVGCEYSMMSWERYQQEIEKANDEYCLDHRNKTNEYRPIDEIDCITCLGAKTCKFDPLG